MAAQLSKSAIIQNVAKLVGDKLSKRDVKDVLEAFTKVGHRELKKTGVFVAPGLAKFVVIKKPATKERQGINPFTKEPTTFKAKPASKKVRVLPLKGLKAFVN